MGPENNPEKAVFSFEDLEIQKFIKKRNIDSNDFELIDKLIKLSQSNKNALIAHFHNYFHLNYSKEDMVNRLKRDIKFLKIQNVDNKDVDNKERILRFHELFLKLIDNYDHFVAHHLERVLEEV